MKRRIAVKVGSNVLTRADGNLDFTRMSALVDQIVELRRRDFDVVLISSGAVASGRGELREDVPPPDEVAARQLFASVGQAKLMNRYFELFRNAGMLCGQVLTTKEHFSTREHYRNQKRCVEVMLAHGVVPVVNENDAVSVTELMFTDNDELSGLIAEMIGASALVILSNVDGVFDGDPAVPSSRVIREIRASDEIGKFISAKKSEQGRGGMESKCGVARRIAAAGVPVVIANGRREDILLKIFDDPAGTVCTRFFA